MVFLMVNYVPTTPAFWRVSIINRCWILSKTFCIYWDNHMVAIFQFAIVVYYIDLQIYFVFLISSLPLSFLLPFIPIWVSWQRILWQLLCINCMIDLLIDLFHSALMLTMKKLLWCPAPHLLGSSFFYLGHR